MLSKLFFTIVAIAVIAAALLGLHQQRLKTLHAMGDLHVQMDRDRKATWDAQAQIAEGTHPVALNEAVKRIGLDLEPLPTEAAQVDAGTAPLWPNPQHFAHAPEHVPARD
ncbi:MAG: hypothetical protein AAGH99_01480 [Planctomycetota bacterium]